MPEATTRMQLRALALATRFRLSLGAGLGRLKGLAFRIGHLADFNELMLAGTLAGVEMGLDTLRSAVPSWRRERGTRGARRSGASGGSNARVQRH